MINKVFNISKEKMNKMIEYYYRNDYNDLKCLYICTACDEPFIKNSDSFRNQNEIECPHCHIKHANIFYSNDIIGVDEANELKNKTTQVKRVYGVIKNINYDIKNFEMEYVQHCFTFTNIEINRAGECKNIEYKKEEKNVTIKMGYTPYKKKEGEYFKTSCLIEGKKADFTQKSLKEILVNCINVDAIIDLNISTPYEELLHHIIQIKDTMKKYPEFAELELSTISDKNTKEALEILEYAKQSEEYRQRVLDCMIMHKNSNFLYYYYCSSKNIISEFPTTNPFYYELIEYFSQENLYYMNYMTDYKIRTFCKQFIKFDYTLEECILLLQFIYRQNIFVSDAYEIFSAHNIYLKYGVDIIKTPREINIYIARAKAITDMENYFNIKNNTISFNSKNYDVDIDNLTTMITKMLSFSNNFKFISKAIMINRDKERSIFTIKDTDYSIVKNNESNIIEQIYNKTNEITNKEEIESILKEIVKGDI